MIYKYPARRIVFSGRIVLLVENVDVVCSVSYFYSESVALYSRSVGCQFYVTFLF